MGEGMITILSGLTEQDEVIVAGIHALHDGEQVTLLQETTETNVGGLL